MSSFSSLEYFSAGVTNFVFDQKYCKKITKNIPRNVEVNNDRKTSFLVRENLWKEILSYVKPSVTQQHRSPSLCLFWSTNENNDTPGVVTDNMTALDERTIIKNFWYTFPTHVREKFSKICLLDNTSVCEQQFCFMRLVSTRVHTSRPSTNPSVLFWVCARREVGCQNLPLQWRHWGRSSCDLGGPTSGPCKSG